MPTNDYLPFATGSGSTILTQAAYNSLVARASGFQQGIADEYSCNKVWRQSSVVAAMLAQFIVDNANVDCLDDGNIAALEAKFAAALQANLLAQLYGAAGYRKRLAADLTLFVSTTGNDSNTGLTSGSALATLQAAWNLASRNYDLNGHTININVAGGTYTAGVYATGMPLSINSSAGATGNPPNCINFIGNVSSPTSVQVNVTNGVCFAAMSGAFFTVNGFHLQASGSQANYQNQGSGLYAVGGGGITFGNVEFGTCTQHIYAPAQGFISSGGAPYSIVGGAISHISSNSASYVTNANSTVTLTGSPAFSGSFVAASACGIANLNNATHNGAATGAKYAASSNGVILTFTGNTTLLPGNAPGVLATGGQYT